MARTLTILGICLLATGAVLLAGPTFGFSSIAADRGVTVGTASDTDAYVGLEPVDESITGRQDTATVARIHNNLGSEMSLTTSVDVGPDLTIDSEFDSTVAPDESTSLTVACDGGGSSGTQSVVVTVESANAAGITVEGATMTVDVDYQCTGNGGSTGPANFEADDVDANGPTQRFRFDVGTLRNKDHATIDLSDAQQNAGVDYTGASATVVSGQSIGSFEFNNITYEITYEAQGNVDGILEIEVTGFEITDDHDGTAYYSDDRGRSDSDTFDVPVVVSGGDAVTTDGNVFVNDGETADDIVAGGDVTTGEDSIVNDGIDAGGDVTLGDESTTSGVVSGFNVTVGADAFVNDGIDADGDVILGDRSSTSGDVGGHNVTVGPGAVANDDVDADRDVFLEDGSSVNGDIYAGGTVYIGCDVTTNGEIHADSIVQEC